MAWQAFIVSFKSGSNHIDFIRLNPKGDFYLWRLLQDDLVPMKVKSGTVLDPILVVIRVAEAIAVGIRAEPGISATQRRASKA